MISCFFWILMLLMTPLVPPTGVSNVFQNIDESLADNEVTN